MFFVSVSHVVFVCHLLENGKRSSEEETESKEGEATSEEGQGKAIKEKKKKGKSEKSEGKVIYERVSINLYNPLLNVQV